MDSIVAWIRGVLIEANMSAISSLFDSVDSAVGDVAYQVGHTPQSWNPAIFAMVRGLSETVIMPVAGLILTYVVCYELIQMVLEKNNMVDFDTFNIFKWIFKTFIAVFILTNTWNIVMGVFQLAQGVIFGASGYITGNLALGSPEMMSLIESQLHQMNVGQLLVMLVQTNIAMLGMLIMGVVITVIVWGRMIEIFLVTSLAPIPFATITNREWGQIGNSYL